MQVFLDAAAAELAGVRSSLLLAAQSGLSGRDIAVAADRIEALAAQAAAEDLSDPRMMAALCVSELKLLSLSEVSTTDVNAALDALARLEAALLEISLRSGDFLAKVNELVDTSFDSLAGSASPVEDSDDADGFEPDDETLEIFREEAETLLANITAALASLVSSPNDTNALWEMRRNAHTFKGAAGIVGLTTASRIAHRLEDLLDLVVQDSAPVDARSIELIANASDHLGKLVAGSAADEPTIASALFEEFDAVLGSFGGAIANSGTPTRACGPSSSANAPQSPIVRVSLDRLDELLTLSRRLVDDHALNGSGSQDVRKRLAQEISCKLLQLRMVRFGTLETRLSRAVHVTCQEENKKATVVIHGADAEIDTQVIDALIEPLLHLLKNAVVHGIEPAETRRLLGKPEKGQIDITVNADATNLEVTVADDGSGIATAKLIEKAAAAGLVDADKELSEKDAIELIFQRGLTTAGQLTMNAGRGVGMSIVRQSVESHGGKLSVVSMPQKGARFTITIPLLAQEEPTAASCEYEQLPLVLIVDDSSSIREQVVKFVTDLGYRTISAADGAEALELLLNGLEPSLILSDVEMPNMNGWEFLEYVKTDHNFGHVPVVLITSLDSEDYRCLATKLGASDYVVKPFGSKQLEHVLGNLCPVAA